MGLTRVAIYRPVAIVMMFLAMAAMGVVAYTHLPISRLPNISFPFVRISTSYPGAAPEDVETLVTKVIEDAVVGVNGINTITSTSIEGASNVGISFVEGTDVNQAAIDVARKVDQARRQLPTDAGDPAIFKADTNAFPVMNIAVSSNQLGLQDLFDVVNDQVQPLVQSVNGVADVTPVGGLKRQIQVRVDPVKLQSYGLSLTQVQNALAQQNLALPGGPIRSSKQVFNTRTQSLAQSADELRRIVINTAAGGAANVSSATVPVGTSTTGATVYLSDVAQVLDTHAFQASYQRFNRADAVGLTVTQQTGVNGIQVSDDIRKTLSRVEASMGASNGIHFEVVNDQAIFTRAAVDDVQRNLYVAVFLTATVLLLFLHTIRNTLMVLVAIPVSLVSTFFVMYVLGFNLDIMSLMALALLIGILVDDSIVVLENINRHLGMGQAPWEAAMNGRSEIGLAAIAITFTDVVVYAPVAFMQGNIGQLFKEFGLTIVAATLFSLLVSFTLTPMLASRLLKGEALEHITGSGPWAHFTRGWEHNFERLRRGYRRALSWSLDHRWLPVLVGFATLGLVISFVPLHILGTEFIPQEDDNLFQINVQMPVGTAVEETGRVMAQIEDQLLAMPEVATLFSSVGVGGFAGQQEQSGQIAVGLVDKSQRSATIQDIIGRVRRFTANMPDVLVRTNIPSPLLGGPGSPVNVVITGPDFDQLQKLTDQVLGIVRNTPGTVEVRTSQIVPSPEFRAIVDRQKAADQGVTSQTIANTLRAAVQGVVAAELRPEGRDQVDILLQLQGAENLTPAQLGAIPVVTNRGTIVRLDQVAEIVPSSSPGQIQRFNRAREIEVQANVSGRSLGDVLRDIRAQTSALDLPVGYTVQISGQGNQLDVAFGALTQALTLSVLLMYMLMAALYESFVYPLSVLFCLPVALVGAFLGLLLTNNTINIFSMIGMIMLVGLVAKNAILLVDYTNTLRRRGLTRRDALLEAGPVRLRPILMTTMTLVFAMIPLALKLGAGAETRSPMAVVVLGGIITSTLLTLVLVPCTYTYLDDLQNVLLRRRGRARVTESELIVRPTPTVAGAEE
jgi:hydrophobic/amphiphilic exporter-1 (mainly G- bacteria), HAE1 family